MIRFSYGGYLAKARKRAKLTQEKLAEMTNCATCTISRIETGEHHPQEKTFKAVDEALGRYGLEYDELTIEELSAARKVANRLLDAIHMGRTDEIDLALMKYQGVMDPDDLTHMQYYLFTNLVLARKRGMTPEEFIEECVEVYQLTAAFPGYDEIAFINLRKIEFVILMKIALAYIEIEELLMARKIMTGLIRNQFDSQSSFRKDRCQFLLHLMAKIHIEEDDYDKTHALLKDIFNEILRNKKYRVLYLNLLVEQQICIAYGDKEGEILLDDFFLASKKLMEHIYKKYIYS